MPAAVQRHDTAAPLLAMARQRGFRFVALDVETANSDPGSICQIGLAGVAGDGTIHCHATLVDPCCGFADFNIRLHGIGPQQVASAPTFAQAFGALSPVLAAQALVQHSGFDARAISAACRGWRLAEPGLDWLDSVRIARRAWPELRGSGGHGLGNLKQVLGLEFTHHDAGEDARAAAMVVLLAEGRTGLDFRALAGRP